MRKKLRIAALLLSLSVFAVWLFQGANTGFTKTSVPRIVKDPVTDLEVQVYDSKFVPGIDFLAAGLALAAVLAGASFLFPRMASPSA